MSHCFFATLFNTGSGRQRQSLPVPAMDKIKPAVFPKGTAGEGPGTVNHKKHHWIWKKQNYPEKKDPQILFSGLLSCPPHTGVVMLMCGRKNKKNPDEVLMLRSPRSGS